MVKKMSKQSGKSGNTSMSEHSVWMASNVLESQSHNPSFMTPENIAEVRLLFKSDPEVVCVLPDDTCCADYYSNGWVCFYNYPFKIGMTFPILKACN